VASSYMTLEAIRAAEMLKEHSIAAEIIDLRTIKPLDEDAILCSVKKTGRLVVVDGAYRSFGVAAEVLALAAEKGFDILKCAPRRVAFADTLTSTSWALANHYYPRAIDIAEAVKEMFNISGVSIRMPALAEIYRWMSLTNLLPDHFNFCLILNYY